jgi:hypothetical protein
MAGEAAVIEGRHFLVAVRGGNLAGLDQVAASVEAEPADRMLAGRVLHSVQKLPADPLAARASRNRPRGGQRSALDSAPAAARTSPGVVSRRWYRLT